MLFAEVQVEIVFSRLVELGPRMTLSLMKITVGVDDGEVLYHSYITKTKNEVDQLRREAHTNKYVFFQLFFLFYWLNNEPLSYFFFLF